METLPKQLTTVTLVPKVKVEPLFPDTAKMLAALLRRVVPNGAIRLSKEEIEDAPEIEMHEFFVTDEVELRLKRNDRNQ